MGSMNNVETASPLMRMMFSEAPLERRPPRFTEQLYHKHAWKGNLKFLQNVQL